MLFFTELIRERGQFFHTVNLVFFLMHIVSNRCLFRLLHYNSIDFILNCQMLTSLLNLKDYQK